jgi:hypothetical protein
MRPTEQARVGAGLRFSLSIFTHPNAPRFCPASAIDLVAGIVLVGESEVPHG